MRMRVRLLGIRPWSRGGLLPLRGWGPFVLLMLLGSSLGRSFYYLGFPPAKIFIGDVVLGLFFVLRPKESLVAWTRFLVRPGVFGAFSWIILLSLYYGLFQVIRGIYAGYPAVVALENLVFNVYPLYFFLGLWVGAENPDLYRRVVRCWAWYLAIYGPVYLLFLQNNHLTMPGASDVPIFGQPGGGGLIILLLLALEPRPGRFWFPILVAAVMLLAIQVRAEWLSVAIGFTIWAVLDRRMNQLVLVGSLVAIVLTIGFVADVNLPSPAERGGSISSREIVARGLSAVDPEMAQEYTDSRNTGFYAGTISWRTRWWRAIWDSVEESYSTRMIGNGYGFPLADLVPYLRGEAIRTPHNIFFFALGYSGWIGVVLFFSLQGALAHLLWRVYKLTGESYGLAVWASSLVGACFGNMFETPAGAIPYYICMGLMIGPVLLRQGVTAPLPSPQRRRRDEGGDEPHGWPEREPSWSSIRAGNRAISC